MSKGKLGMWCGIAATSIAAVAAVAPAAHATPPGTAARPTTTALVRTCSDWVELKWPNGTGTGVWVRECS